MDGNKKGKPNKTERTTLKKGITEPRKSEAYILNLTGSYYYLPKFECSSKGILTVCWFNYQ